MGNVIVERMKEELNLCILVKISFKSDMYYSRYQQKNVTTFVTKVQWELYY